MKNKKLIFLSLVLGMLLLSGCTKYGSFSSRGLAGTQLHVFENVARFILGSNIYDGLISILKSYMSILTALIFIYVIILMMPYVSVYLIFYGFLKELRIFRSANWINIVLAFTITTSAMFMPLPFPPFLGLPLFGWLVKSLFFLMTGWSVIVFAALFFVGTIYFFKIRHAQWGTSAGVYAAYRDEAKGLRFELRSANEALAEAMRKMAQETDPDKRSAIEKSVQELSDRRNDVSERIRELEQARRQF